MGAPKVTPDDASADEAAATVPAQRDHVEAEDYPWAIHIPGHPRRTESADYRAARKRMKAVVATLKDFFYGRPPHEDHHGGGLWLKDDEGWFLVRNVAGMEWSSQFCADPAKVDELRRTAQRLYARFPEAVDALGIRELLDTPIATADDVARWTDSICNASVPLPKSAHTGVIPKGGGVHHYPSPVAEIAFFKYDDFELWVTDEDGHPAAVTPVDRRGSGNGAVKVVYATPGSRLAAAKDQLADDRPPVVGADHPLAVQAFQRQTAPADGAPVA